MSKVIRRFVPKFLKRRVRLSLEWLSAGFQYLRLGKLSKSRRSGAVLHLGVTEHRNLGDLAQCLCIREWIQTNYPDRLFMEFGASAVVHPSFGFVDKLSRVLTDEDIIVFQSGYNTQDLGGNHPHMHRKVLGRMKNAVVLMMPQTIFFQHAGNRQLTSRTLNEAERILFLARDEVSFNSAREMFPDIAVELFPDIVTTRIGRYRFDHPRDRILLCCRNDGEKHYSNMEINNLHKRICGLLPADLSDTNSTESLRSIRKRLAWCIDREIERFAKYRLTITDRYHGTIFSLAANTPVIVLKTTDHKVTTGAEWFRGVYDDYVFVAESLEHAYELAEHIIHNVPIRTLNPHFQEQYYDKLKDLFEEASGLRDSS